MLRSLNLANQFIKKQAYFKILNLRNRFEQRYLIKKIASVKFYNF
jgi:hypothetical protein